MAIAQRVSETKDRCASIRAYADKVVTLVRVKGVRKQYEAHNADDYMHFCHRVMEMGDWDGVTVAQRSA